MAVYEQVTNGSRYLAIRLTLTELPLTETDISNNQSRIEWKFELYETSDYGSWYNYHDLYAHLDLNGVRVGRWIVDHDFSASGANSKIIAQGTYTCPHNADGSKSMAFSAVYNSPNVSSSNGTATISGNLSLTTVPRATTPTVNKSSLDLGTPVTISTPRAASGFTHKLKYAFEGTTGTIASGVGTSYEWTPPLSLASRIPSKTSGTCVITCETYNGSTLIGSKTVYVTLTVPASVIPSLSYTTAEAVAGIAAKIGAYVQGKSKLKVVTTASGVYGSTIDRIVVHVKHSDDANFTQYNGSSITTATLSKAGTYTVWVYVYDTRGRYAREVRYITVLAYSKPAITRFNAFRSTSAGAALDDGTYARISQKFAITSLNNQNDKTWTVQFRRVGTTTWQNISSGSVYTYDGAFTSSSAILSTEYSYELRLVISDYFETAIVQTSISTAFTLMDFRATGRGMAVGKVSEKDAFEVGIPAEFTAGLKSNGSEVLTQANNSLLPYQSSGDLNSFIRSHTPSRGSLQFSAIGMEGFPTGVTGGIFTCLRDASFSGSIVVILHPTGGSPDAAAVYYGRSGASSLVWL